MYTNNQQAFIALVKAGLWVKEARLSQFDEIGFSEVMRIAEEQSIVGLATAGLEHVADVNVPQEILLQFVGQTLQIEQQNKAMNAFIGRLIDDLRNAGIFVLLVKGQGIAQCYEKPLWRASGDIDLLLNDEDYIMATEYISRSATSIKQEKPQTKHLGMNVDGWTIELHGSLASQLGKKIDGKLFELQADCFDNSRVRSWHNGQTDVFMPDVDNDVIFVFAHILQHLFKGGIGLRQVCDWTRLLWTYRKEINRSLLVSRLKEMGIVSEWKTFAALVVNWLGMPVDAMPLYDKRYKKKGELLLDYIIDVGNFGHNRELSYTMEQPAFIRKLNITKVQLKDSLRLTRLFPIDAPRFFFSFLWNGLRNAVGK